MDFETSHPIELLYQTMFSLIVYYSLNHRSLGVFTCVIVQEYNLILKYGYLPFIIIFTQQDSS